MKHPTQDELISIAKRLEDFAEMGVFTAEHRWQTVVDAAAVIRAVASTVTSQVHSPTGE